MLEAHVVLEEALMFECEVVLDAAVGSKRVATVVGAGLVGQPRLGCLQIGGRSAAVSWFFLASLLQPQVSRAERRRRCSLRQCIGSFWNLIVERCLGRNASWNYFPRDDAKATVGRGAPG